MGSLFEAVFRFLHALFELLDFLLRILLPELCLPLGPLKGTLQSREFPLKGMYSLLPVFNIFLPVEIRSFYM